MLQRDITLVKEERDLGWGETSWDSPRADAPSSPLLAHMEQRRKRKGTLLFLNFFLFYFMLRT